MGKHPLDREMGLAGVGRPEHSLDPGGEAQHGLTVGPQARECKRPREDVQKTQGGPGLARRHGLVTQPQKLERLGMSDTEVGRRVDWLAPPERASLPVISVRPDGLPQALDALDPTAAAFARASGFSAASGQLVLVPAADGLAAALLGLGTDRAPFPHGELPFALPENTVWRLEPGDFDAEAAILAFCLGAYQFTPLRNPKRGPALLAGAEPDT